MRLIDKDRGRRTRPMKVLVLGLPLTGISSLCLALEKLGYKVFHMNENFNEPTRFFPLWIEAMNAKFDNDDPAWDEEEFDKLLGQYDAAADLPVALFGEELISAYPDAKIILTLRDSSSWVASMQKSIYLILSWSSWSMLTPFDNLIRLWHECDARDWDCFLDERYPGRRDYLSKPYTKLARKKFDEHYERIRKASPKNQLLEHRHTDGWGPLCKFLGHEVPKQPYPEELDTDTLVKTANAIWWAGIPGAVGIVMMLVAMLAWMYWYWIYRM